MFWSIVGALIFVFIILPLIIGVIIFGLYLLFAIIVGIASLFKGGNL